MKRPTDRRGSTLVELVISIAILALALLAMIYLFFSLSKGVVAAQQRSTAAYLARDLMEEIMSRQFDEKQQKTDDGSGNLIWSSLGTDTGESTSNRSTLDDIDDFNGMTENLTSPHTGYTRTVSVAYATTAAHPDNLDDTGGADRDYKRIRVQVTKQGVTYADISMIKVPRR